jgi:hypothetical protein
MQNSIGIVRQKVEEMEDWQACQADTTDCPWQTKCHSSHTVKNCILEKQILFCEPKRKNSGVPPDTLYQEQQ